MGRAHHFEFHFHQEREPRLLLLWNGGCPLLIDGRFRRLVITELSRDYTKEILLDWAAQNDCRCVGFDGQACHRPRSIQRRENTWAAE